jgi:hypothetical protein
MAWETVRELMAAAVEEPDLRPGMVAVIQTFGDRVNPHPHVHALVTRGGWTRDDRFLPVPYADPGVAQRLFQHKVLALLEREALITQERVALLLSWRHTGFSVQNTVRVAPDDTDGLEALVRYLMRPPVSLARLQLLPGGQVSSVSTRARETTPEGPRAPWDRHDRHDERLAGCQVRSLEGCGELWQ